MRTKTSTDTVFHHYKVIFAPSLGLKKPKISRRKFLRQSWAKNIRKIAEVKKKL